MSQTKCRGWNSLTHQKQLEKERHHLAVKARKQREKKNRMENRKAKRKYQTYNLTCIVCSNSFQSKYRTAKYCSRGCWTSYNRMRIKGNKKSEAIRKASKACNADKQELILEKKRKAAIKSSPDLSQLIPVRIDQKTLIFIKADRDPEEARTNFINKYSTF